MNAFEPVDEPSFSFEVLFVGGVEAGEVRAVQARAIKELLRWAHQERLRREVTGAEPPAPAGLWGTKTRLWR
ncbi:MAG: hypothetical protein ACYDAQ_03190 [Mycobacteriales bacterium]